MKSFASDKKKNHKIIKQSLQFHRSPGQLVTQDPVAMTESWPEGLYPLKLFPQCNKDVSICLTIVTNCNQSSFTQLPCDQFSS